MERHRLLSEPKQEGCRMKLLEILRCELGSDCSAGVVL